MKTEPTPEQIETAKKVLEWLRHKTKAYEPFATAYIKLCAETAHITRKK